MIKISSYNPDWYDQYKSEKQLLKSTLGSKIVLIEHIGSTSIPGCPAKPILDIMIVLPSIQNESEITKYLQAIGYTRRYWSFFMRLFFYKDGSPEVQLHIFQQGYSEIERFIKFRDWLIQHPDDLQKYKNLKISLANENSNDLENYSFKKESFVTEIELKAGWCCGRLLEPYTEEEKQLIQDIQSTCNINPGDTKKSFIIRHNNKYIGYAFILVHNQRIATIRLFGTNDIFYQDPIQNDIRTDLTMWLKNQNIQTIHYNIN